jgi:hypothetical protein
MAFEPQNDLERSLMRASADPAHRPQFYRDFVASQLFVIDDGEPAAKEGETTLQEGRALRLRTIELNGKLYLPVFSSLLRLQAVLQEQASYIALNALEFLKITRGADLVLNPWSDYGKEFTAAEVESILDGSIGRPDETYVAQKDTQVLLGQPANYPTELVAALGRLFAAREDVTRAWVAHFHDPARDEKPHTLVALEVTGDWDEIAAAVGIVVKSTPLPDPPVDLLRVTGREGIEEYFNSIEPFYQRTRSGPP